MDDLLFARALLPEGWADDVLVKVHDGRIAAVHPDSPRCGRMEAGVAVPGLCNVHSHAFQRALAGLTQIRGPSDDDFWTWRQAMYDFLDRIGPDDVEAIAALAYVEMLERGFTRVGEFQYLHNAVDGRPYANPSEMAERICAAAADTGIGLTLLPSFYAHGGFGPADPSPGQRRFVTRLDGFAHLVERCQALVAGLADGRLGVAPHSLRAVTPEELAHVAGLLPAAPIHIHAAEQTREVDDCVAWSGLRPVAWLLRHADIDARWCVIHATHMTPDETDDLARAGAVAGLCPVTEADLGDGVFPASAFLAAGGRIGVGTDSNVAIDAADELRLLEYAQRLTRRARNVLASGAYGSTAGTLFRAALAGGGVALATPSGITAGAPADIVVLKPDAEAAGDAALDSWVFGNGATAVLDVWRGGVRVVAQGRHVARDRIEARFRQTMRRLAA